MKEPKKGSVILIPGLGAPKILMMPLGFRLKRAGYNPVYMTYSLHTPLEDHVHRLKKVISGIKGPFSVVTHSYGAMICRNAYSDPKEPSPDRVVMIAPVNQGSHLARKWYDLTAHLPIGHRLMGLVAGPVPFQILPEQAKDPTKFPVCDVDIGVISFVLPTWLCKKHPLLNGMNDGTTMFNETFIPGMKDFVVVTGEHNTSLIRRDVAEYVIRFLDSGRFR